MTKDRKQIRSLKSDITNIVSIIMSTTGDIEKLEYMDNYQAIKRAAFVFRKLRKKELREFEDKLKEVRKSIQEKATK